MSKYIDAEKLTKNLRDIAASIEKRLHNIVEPQDKSSIDEEQLPQILLKNRVDKSFFNGELSFYDDVLTLIDSLQQEQPMPNSTKLIELWHEDKEMLKEKDFRDDPWRLAYNAFMCGFGRGIVVNKQDQPDNMIQWTGSNLQEVIDFTGKSPKFSEWFQSWEEFESYVHSHGDILKLFSEDGSHFEVSVGAWIVKTPDGYNVPSIARFIQAKQEQPEFPTTDEEVENQSR